VNRGALAFLLRRLPLDARGRRAVDEVLADWRHEAGACRSGSSRALTHARFALAIFHVLALTTARARASALLSGVIPMTLMWLLIFYAAAASIGGHLFWQIYELPSGVWPVLVATGFVSFLTFNLPFALLLALLVSPRPPRTKRTRALVGWGVGGGLFAVSGWLLPEANQLYRQVASDAYGNVGILTRGIAELSLDALLALGSPRAWEQAAFLLGLALSCPVMVRLAAGLRERRRHGPWRTGVFLLVAYVLTLELLGGLVPRVLAPWLFPTIVAVLMATPLARREQVA
jgi:hypothetical protein